jgi:hypothetical protein
MSIHRLLFSLVLAAAGSGGCARPNSHADARPNVVDDVVLPMLAANGLSVAAEDAGVLCRRIALDLTGLPPTADEMAQHCNQDSAYGLATYFMNKPNGPNVPDGSPPYVYVNRRWWADQFEYNSGLNASTTYYVYVRDLDQAVADLYAGNLTYDAFTKKALASPAFARRFGIFEANHDLVQIASQAFRVFLGREALPSEAEDFGNLWRGWSTRYMDEATSEATYPDCPVAYDQQMNRIGCRHYELGLVGPQCAGENLAGCQSTALGPGQVAPSTAGFVRWADLSRLDQAALETPGRLIAAQPEFAEAIVDRALAKYLGWWKAGQYRPDYDVPAVRDALVRKLASDGYDLRKLELEIVSSVLYTQRAARDSRSTTVPIWAFGPTKQLYAEAWLDSVAQALGKHLGGCDFRYTGNGARLIAGSFKFATSGAIGANFYGSTAQNLGGCPVASTHGDAAGLVPAVTRRVALAQLCPGAIVPSGHMLGSLVQQVFVGVGRPASDFEATTMVAHLGDPADGGCDANNLDGCAWQKLANGLCTSLFASSSFNYY